MSDDIVVRLRRFGPEWTETYTGRIVPYEICADAAAEIERLRALNTELVGHVDDEGRKLTSELVERVARVMVDCGGRYDLVMARAIITMINAEVERK
jgi:hypothetical protein